MEQILGTAGTQGILLAQAAPAEEGGSGLGMFLLLGAMFLFMYAIIIYPQRKQQKEHQRMLSKVERGDQVVTSGGIHGKVTGISDDVVTVEIADRVRIKLSKSAISSRVPAGGGKKS